MFGMRTRGRLSAPAWIVAVALAIGGGAAAAPALAEPATFWGIDPQLSPSLEQLQRARRGGVDTIRVPVPWSAVEPSSGTQGWGGVDALVGHAASAGLDILPFVYDAPSWAVAPAWVPGTGHGLKAPGKLPVSGAARGAWTRFLQAAVARYGPNGSFWAENPAVPARPVRTWQIWNEPNFKYFVARPNPAEYGKLVKFSYGALRSIDPGAKLLLGGMFARPREATFKSRPRQAYFAADFLNRMYRATPGIKSKFIGVALHPYARRYQLLTPEIEEVRDALKRNRDAGKALWITELGWSSQRPTRSNLFAKGVSGQATQLKGAFSLLRHKQRKWRIKRVYWFSLEDSTGACNFCDGSGLFGDGFTPKPAWNAYVRFAGGRP